MSEKTKVIYEPRGRALEYAYLACNLYGGVCPHKCSYCYVPSASRKSRKQWEDTPWYVRKNILELLEHDAKILSGTDKRVLLCFHCDPYSQQAVGSGVTRKALGILRDNDVPFQVLTKGGTRASADFDLYGKNDAFACTMAFTRTDDQLKYEPLAPWPFDRQDALREARKHDIEMWVSLEPVIIPEQSLDIIRSTHDEVCLYKIGKINHDKQREAEIDWGRFAYEAMNLCCKYDTPFVFKKDLLAHCDFEVVGAATHDPRLVDRQKPEGMNA